MSENQDVKICLFAIMRQEEKNVKRCIDSAIKSKIIDAICITDTGSTDRTIELIEEYSSQLPTKVYQNAFAGFGPSRTQSYINAKEFVTSLNWNLERSYGVTIDADMEIFSENFDKDSLKENFYLIEQRASTLNYFNSRLFKFSQNFKCECRTHEYWARDAGGNASKLFSIYIKDHNDGGFKQDKFLRDEILLKQDLIDKPLNVRSLFYLGNTCYNLGKYDEAIEYYLLRCQERNFIEECASAKLGVARCYKNKLLEHERKIKERGIEKQGKELDEKMKLLRKELDEEKDNKILIQKRAEIMKVFDQYQTFRKKVLKMEKKTDNLFSLFKFYSIQAWQDLPKKIEPLVEMITFLRERGFNKEASLYLDICFATPYPRDCILFVDSACYHERCYYERSIVDYYTERKKQATLSNDWVQFLGTKINYVCTGESNRKFNAVRLERTEKMTIKSIIDDYVSTSPSIVKFKNDFVVNVRHVNYKYEKGSYTTKDNCPVRTHQALLQLTSGLVQTNYDPIPFSFDQFSEKNINVQGYEDARLFVYHNSVYAIANCKNENGGIDMNIWRYKDNQMIDIRKLSWEGQRKVEKNWLPYIVDNKVRIMYDMKTRLSLNVETGKCDKIEEFKMRDSFNKLRLSAGPVKFGDKYLIIVHDVEYGNVRHYCHRFVVLTGENLQPVKVSIPFFFNSPDIEYVCGFVEYGNNYLIGYSVKDCSSNLCEVKREYIESLMNLDIC
jgi:predicted GH43/DUF377 family glycosyl hydrolase/tetratricopeptide (TPR) repeat protein